MYYKVIEDADYARQFNEEPIMFIGNERAILDFVSERNDEEEYGFIKKIEDAKDWLRDNGYEIEEIPNLIARLEKGSQNMDIVGGTMYKLVNKDTKDLYLGTEKAVIRFANDKLNDKDKEWMYLYQDKLLDLGFVKRSDSEVEEITNIELATKYLQTVEDIEVVDIGYILNELQNNEVILLSQEE